VGLAVDEGLGAVEQIDSFSNASAVQHVLKEGE
jgi:hypothetical protein